MRFSDIKERHIYTVIFDPVRNCEFNGKHLALVIKRNNDKQTYIVMPLTSASSGAGYNKIKLEKINSLPTSLRDNTSYAVYNQIRTVNANRFIALKEGVIRIESIIDDNMYFELLKSGIKDLIYSVDFDKKIQTLKEIQDSLRVDEAINMAYTIKRMKGNVKSLEIRINQLVSNIEIIYSKKQLNDEVDIIISDIICKIKEGIKKI